jgi:hypothetical protein
VSWAGAFKGTLIGAGLVIAFSKARALTKTVNELDTLVSGKLKSFTPDKGLVLEINVQINNPNSGTAKFTHPYVRVLLGESLIGVSTMAKTEYQLKAYQSTVLKPIEVTLSKEGLVIATLAIAKALKTKKALELKLEIRYTGFVIGISKTYTQTETIQIKF